MIPLPRRPGPRPPWRALALALALGVCSCESAPRQPDDWQLEPVVGEGGRVLGFSGSYAYRSGEEDREWFAARATIEEFLTDSSAIGGFALGQFANRSEDTDGQEQLWLGGHYRLHYHVDERASLFVGPSIGLAYFDDETANGAAFAWGLSAGFRYWLSQRAAITFEPTFLRAEFGEDQGGPTDDVLLLWGFAFSL